MADGDDVQEGQTPAIPLHSNGPLHCGDPMTKDPSSDKINVSAETYGLPGMLPRFFLICQMKRLTIMLRASRHRAFFCKGISESLKRTSITPRMEIYLPQQKHD